MDAPEPSLGRVMLISCWHCSLCLMRLTVREGPQLLTCDRCHRVTKVTVSNEKETWSLQCSDA